MFCSFQGDEIRTESRERGGISPLIGSQFARNRFP